MKTCVLFVSRHTPLPYLIRFIDKRLGGNYKFVTYSSRVDTAETFFRQIVKPLLNSFDKVIIIPILPLTVIQRLLEIAKETNRVEIWFQVMKEVARVSSEQEAIRLVQENPEKRVFQRYRDTIKVFELVSIKRLRDIKIILEDI